MSQQSYVYKRAAECERLMNEETDEVQRSAYKALMEMWIGLANECLSMDPKEFARQFDDLDEIQRRFQNINKP